MYSNGSCHGQLDPPASAGGGRTLKTARLALWGYKSGVPDPSWDPQNCRGTAAGVNGKVGNYAEGVCEIFAGKKGLNKLP